VTSHIHRRRVVPCFQGSIHIASLESIADQCRHLHTMKLRLYNLIRRFLLFLPLLRLANWHI